MNAISKIQEVLIRHDVPEDQRAGILNSLQIYFRPGEMLEPIEPPDLVLQRPLCTFDIESTGTDPMTDKIITLAVLRIDPADLFEQKPRETRKTWIVNPGRPIPPDATRVHGITDAMVKDCPLIEFVAKEIREMMSGADLCGFNLLKFDVPILCEELQRAELDLPLEGVQIVDVSEIYRKKEPRTLTAAVKKFCGRDHEGAHEAMADVVATLETLNGQRATYPDLANLNIAGLSEFSMMMEFNGQPAKRLDLAGYIIEDFNGVARYTLKKVQGVAVVDDPGFGVWMLRNSFPTQTKQVLRKILEAAS